MSPAPASPPPPPPVSPPARPFLYTLIGLLALLGTVLVLAGVIAALRAGGPARDALLLGRPAWQFATAGVLCTLAAGLWLQRLVK